jgi:hypothetical protein
LSKHDTSARVVSATLKLATDLLRFAGDFATPLLNGGFVADALAAAVAHGHKAKGANAAGRTTDVRGVMLLHALTSGNGNSNSNNNNNNGNGNGGGNGSDVVDTATLSALASLGAVDFSVERVREEARAPHRVQVRHSSLHCFISLSRTGRSESTTSCTGKALLFIASFLHLFRSSTGSRTPPHF